MRDSAIKHNPPLENSGANRITIGFVPPRSLLLSDGYHT
ncbi:hypothetical protein SRDD_37870 [Serratia sp. DD3]|nr:hypothetical protein SRDD_37870 [Serratia sp. DD3]